MKRLNPKTNKPFVIGEAREDGYRFDGYITARIKLDGYYKENWRHPERYLLNRQYQRDRMVSYPSLQEQLDLIYWDKINDTEKWKETIDKVKLENPKPSE